MNILEERLVYRVRMMKDCTFLCYVHLTPWYTVCKLWARIEIKAVVEQYLSADCYTLC